MEYSAFPGHEAATAGDCLLDGAAAFRQSRIGVENSDQLKRTQEIQNILLLLFG